MAILRRTVAVPLRPQGTRFCRKRRQGREGPPLREERRFGWQADQWEATTAAQRGAAAECKHSPARCGPRVSPRAPRRVWDHRGRPRHPRAAILCNACLALCSSPPTEVRINPLPPPRSADRLPPMDGSLRTPPPFPRPAPSHSEVPALRKRSRQAAPSLPVLRT